jgi:hypothetical protein
VTDFLLPTRAVILPECAQRLNRIIQETGAGVVLSSAWRNLIHSGEMTAKGFQCLSETHKVCCQVLGATPEKGGVLGRGKQIAARQSRASKGG